MSFLQKQKLTEYKPNITSNPIARRRSKLAFKVEEQIRLAVDSTYRPTKIVWNTDSDGNQHKVEQPKRIRCWWIEHTDGSVQLTVRYGSKPLELAKGKTAIVLDTKEAVEPTLRNLKLAVLSGELDAILTQQIGITKPLSK
jgi:hypothetical protein